MQVSLRLVWKILLSIEYITFLRKYAADPNKKVEVDIQTTLHGILSEGIVAQRRGRFFFFWQREKMQFYERYKFLFGCNKQILPRAREAKLC